jgi:hypothetical protein
MLVELWRQAGDKFAGRNENRVPLRPTDRMNVAGTTDLVEADRLVSELCASLKYRLDRYPNRWVVTVRNFSKRNGFSTQESDTVSVRRERKTSASESKSDSDSNSNSKSNTESCLKTMMGMQIYKICRYRGDC